MTSNFICLRHKAVRYAAFTFVTTGQDVGASSPLKLFN